MFDKFTIEMQEKFKEDACRYSLKDMMNIYDTDEDTLLNMYKQFDIESIVNKINMDKEMYQASVDERTELMKVKSNEFKDRYIELLSLQQNIENKKRLLSLLDSINADNYNSFTKEENSEFYSKPKQIDGIEEILFDYVEKVYGKSEELKVLLNVK